MWPEALAICRRRRGRFSPGLFSVAGMLRRRSARFVRRRGFWCVTPPLAGRTRLRLRGVGGSGCMRSGRVCVSGLVRALLWVWILGCTGPRPAPRESWANRRDRCSRRLLDGELYCIATEPRTGRSMGGWPEWKSGSAAPQCFPGPHRAMPRKTKMPRSIDFLETFSLPGDGTTRNNGESAGLLDTEHTAIEPVCPNRSFWMIGTGRGFPASSPPDATHRSPRFTRRPPR